ncbi:hypothetical protein FCV25MIE_18886, partial [Fagus crenata]
SSPKFAAKGYASPAAGCAIGTTGQAGETTTSQSRSQGFGHGFGYASDSTGSKTTVARYGSRIGTDLSVLMPMLLGINIDMTGMLCLDGLCRNSEHARLLQ